MPGKAGFRVLGLGLGVWAPKTTASLPNTLVSRILAYRVSSIVGGGGGGEGILSKPQVTLWKESVFFFKKGTQPINT